MSDDLYDTDFLLWTERQAELLRAGRLSELDVANIAEEIESLGRLELHQIRTSLREMMIALVRLERATDRRERAAIKLSIRQHQRAIKANWSPSVASRLDMAKLWQDARGDMLVGEMDPPPPEECPITLDVVLSMDLFVRP